MSIFPGDKLLKIRLVEVNEVDVQVGHIVLNWLRLLFTKIYSKSSKDALEGVSKYQSRNSTIWMPIFWHGICITQ